MSAKVQFGGEMVLGFYHLSKDSRKVNDARVPQIPISPSG